MKRFLLFAGETYYPGGGVWDFKGDFDTLAEAEAELESRRAADSAYREGLKAANAAGAPALAALLNAYPHGGPERVDWWHVLDTDAEDIAVLAVTSDQYDEEMLKEYRWTT